MPSPRPQQFLVVTGNKMAQITADSDSRRIKLTQQMDDLIKGLKLSGTAIADYSDRNRRVRPSAAIDASYPIDIGRGQTITPSASVGVNAPSRVGVRFIRKF